MKRLTIGILVLSVLLGHSALCWADEINFPVNFNTSFSNQNTNTLVKMDGSELRISITTSEGESVKDYTMNVDQGSIAEYPGNMVTRDGEGWETAYEAVMGALSGVKHDLIESGDTQNSDLLSTTISFLRELE